VRNSCWWLEIDCVSIPSYSHFHFFMIKHSAIYYHRFFKKYFNSYIYATAVQQYAYVSWWVLCIPDWYKTVLYYYIGLKYPAYSTYSIRASHNLFAFISECIPREYWRMSVLKSYRTKFLGLFPMYWLQIPLLQYTRKVF
jgi:hypothetical protein